MVTAVDLGRSTKQREGEAWEHLPWLWRNFQDSEDDDTGSEEQHWSSGQDDEGKAVTFDQVPGGQRN